MSNSKSEDTTYKCFIKDCKNFVVGTEQESFIGCAVHGQTLIPEPPQGTLKESGNLNTSEEHVKDTSLYDTEAENWLLELLIDYSGMDFCGAEECLSWQACREFMAEVENHIAQQRAKLFELIRSEVLNTVVEDDKIEAWKNGELLKILQDFTK
jgi:hypothetical protein